MHRPAGTGRAITFVTPKQRDEIPRIERGEDHDRRVGAARGADRARPRPRRRDHRRERERLLAEEELAGADGAGDGNGLVKAFVNWRSRSGIGEQELRWAPTEGARDPRGR